MCLRAITTLFTAICALIQNDIQKIIAFSTSSQLGLIIVTIGINQPYLAFLHIYTHTFFKPRLFMSSRTALIFYINHFENNAFLVNSIKHLLTRSIFAGFIISNNIPQTTVPQITIPCHLKPTALAVIILSFILALKISNMAQNLKFNCSSGIQVLQTPKVFPTIIHHLTPYLNLTTSQKSASSLLDLIWLENIYQKPPPLFR